MYNFHITLLNATYRFINTLLMMSIISCSIPDLRDEETQQEALLSAVEISELKKEFMYGMMWLYTDDQNETFTGWVKENHPEGKTKRLGYLNNGQKQGVWMEWHPNGLKQSEVEWNKSYLDGSLKCWHPNGILKAFGFIIDGEMDGEWKEYYTNGQLQAHSLNQMGKCIWKRIWKINGELCPESKLEEGSGFYMEYKENGEAPQKRIFKEGVEIKSSPANPF